ncbi:MAG: helix-turn-helix domain-containing protein [Patescibacteria group bacterium]
MVHEDLQNLGLSDKEASVYLAALELGSDTVQRIAQKAKVKRVTTYVVLQTLLKKGLVSKIDKSKKTLFIAEEPSRLVRFIEQQIKDLDFKKNTIQGLISQLKLITNSNPNKPIVRFYEGKEGVDALMDEFIKEFRSNDTTKQDASDDSHNLFIAYSRDLLEKIFSKEERERGRKERLKAKIEARPLYNWQKPTEDFKLSKGIKLSYDLFPFPCDIAVFQDKIRLISLTAEPTAVLIIDKNLAEGLRSLFKLAHHGAQELKKNKI